MSEPMVVTIGTWLFAAAPLLAVEDGAARGLPPSDVKLRRLFEDLVMRFDAPELWSESVSAGESAVQIHTTLFQGTADIMPPQFNSTTKPAECSIVPPEFASVTQVRPHEPRRMWVRC
jgi:hypothetical protein